jgi:hypothetical protein
MEGAVSRGVGLLLAIGVGLAALAAVGIVAVLSESLRFTPLSAWTGIALLGLAVLAQLGLASSHVGEQPAALRPFAHDPTPVTGPTSSEQRPARRGSLFLLLVAAPCLIAAAVTAMA